MFLIKTNEKSSRQINESEFAAEDDEDGAILMAEVYIVGQICSAVDFREPNLFLRWNFQAGLCNGDVNKSTL